MLCSAVWLLTMQWVNYMHKYHTVDVVVGQPSIMSLLHIQGSSLICKASLVTVSLSLSPLLHPDSLSSLYPSVSLSLSTSIPVLHHLSIISAKTSLLFQVSYIFFSTSVLFLSYFQAAFDSLQLATYNQRGKMKSLEIKVLYQYPWPSPNKKMQTKWNEACVPVQAVNSGAVHPHDILPPLQHIANAPFS